MLDAIARPEDCRMLLDLHIAEYTALTTRNTYYTTIAASFLQAGLIFLTVGAAAWGFLKEDHGPLIWGLGLGVQALFIAFNLNTEENYTTILYIVHTILLSENSAGARSFRRGLSYRLEMKGKIF